MTDLSFTSTDELINELVKRFIDIVIIGNRITSEDKKNLRFVKFGTISSCLGLCKLMEREILAEYKLSNKEEIK